jgi:hypothetical protein
VGSRSKAPGGGSGAKPPEADEVFSVEVGNFIVCRVGEMYKKRLIYKRHKKLEDIAMHSRHEMVQLGLRSLDSN